MKVLHVQKVAGIGGSERHLLTLLPDLARRGHEVAMLGLVAPGGDAPLDAFRAAGVPTAAVPAGAHWHPALVGHIAREIRRRAPNLVHTHLIHADLYGQVAARLAGVPGVSSVHGVAGPYLREPSRSAAALAGRLASRTIAISGHAARVVDARRLAPRARVRVVPYGVDASEWDAAPGVRADTRHRLGIAVGDVAVVVASRLVDGKGHEVALEAFCQAIVECPQLRLVVAGEGPLRGSLEARASSGLGRSRVQFVGFVPDMMSLLAAADVVLVPTLPALGEGFGLVALEAMAARRPVVASAIDPIIEVLVDGETGLLVPPGDAAALARALVRLAKDEELRRRLGAEGRARAERWFGVDRMVDGVLAVYDEALYRRGAESVPMSR